MSIIQILYIGLGLLVLAFLLVGSFYGWYAIWYAYFKTKDERQKYIVLRSTAHAFTIILGYYLLKTIVVFSMNEQLMFVWEALHFNITSTTPIAGMLAVLGACLFVNKRKAGGDE